MQTHQDNKKTERHQCCIPECQKQGIRYSKRLRPGSQPVYNQTFQYPRPDEKSKRTPLITPVLKMPAQLFSGN